jgi:hypothetical protein
MKQQNTLFVGTREAEASMVGWSVWKGMPVIFFLEGGNVELDLTRLWKMEEKKYLTESDHPSRKHLAIESEKNLREYLIATNYPLAFSLPFVYSS